MLHIIIQIHINTPSVPHIYTHHHGWVRGGWLNNQPPATILFCHSLSLAWLMKTRESGSSYTTSHQPVWNNNVQTKFTSDSRSLLQVQVNSQNTPSLPPPRVGCCCEMLGSVFKRDFVCVRGSFGRVKLLWFGIMWSIWTQRLVMEIKGFIYLFRIKLCVETVHHNRNSFICYISQTKWNTFSESTT